LEIEAVSHGRRRAVARRDDAEPRRTEVRELEAIFAAVHVERAQVTWPADRRAAAASSPPDRRRFGRSVAHEAAVAPEERMQHVEADIGTRGAHVNGVRPFRFTHGGCPGDEWRHTAPLGTPALTAIGTGIKASREVAPKKVCMQSSLRS